MNKWLWQHRVNVIGEKMIMALVWKLPRWLVYWCAIRLGAETTTGKYGNTEVPRLTLTEAIKRWEK